MENQNVEENVKTSVTEDTLKAALECAVLEQPGNKQLQLSIGSVINRFFRNRDNISFVTETIKSLPGKERDDIVTSQGFSEWKPGQGTFKKKLAAPSPEPKKETVAGKGIAEVMARLGGKLAEKINLNEISGDGTGETLPPAEESGLDATVADATQETQEIPNESILDPAPVISATLQVGNETKDQSPERNPLLDLTNEEFEKMYGGLKGLKAFAKETFNIDPPRTANVDYMVKLIKAKIEDAAS